ncbi:MAG: ubiquinone/menaquinone biosynthesis methyltransferase [Planctomycetes bacterium]|nr:ubiquinone/menaquinone biosynthesis methyltransferase [Planctomycetota bacterium]
MIEERAHPFLDKERRKIQRLFDGIAGRYDFLNHLLSFQLDRAWRRRAVAALRPVAGGSYLDACSGTGDLAFALARSLLGAAGAAPCTRIYASDFSRKMLEIGAAKAASLRAPAPRFLAGDTLALPFADRVFDGALIGFGMRNVENLPAALAELRRVLRADGRIVILEFTPLRNRALRPLANIYTRRLLPFIGNLLSGTKDGAYRYLNDSIARWPDAAELAKLMRASEWRDVSWRALFPGNVALHTARR